MQKIFSEDVILVLNPFLKKCSKKKLDTLLKKKNYFIQIRKYSSDRVENEIFYKPISKIL